jgi:hypothetical protein
MMPNHIAAYLLFCRVFAVQKIQFDRALIHVGDYGYLDGIEMIAYRQFYHPVGFFLRWVCYFSSASRGTQTAYNMIS